MEGLGILDLKDESKTAREADALWSVGSDLHSTGQCSPCAWHWSKHGCRNGATKGGSSQQVEKYGIIREMPENTPTLILTYMGDGRL